MSSSETANAEFLARRLRRETARSRKAFVDKPWVRRFDRSNGVDQAGVTGDQLAAAALNGLQVRYLPVVPGRLGADDVEELAKAMRELPAPPLAYCRTGTRSASLWALTQAGQLSADAILKTTAAAGYELGGLRARLESENHHRGGRRAAPAYRA